MERMQPVVELFKFVLPIVNTIDKAAEDGDVQLSELTPLLMKIIDIPVVVREFPKAVQAYKTATEEELEYLDSKFAEVLDLRNDELENLIEIVLDEITDIVAGFRNVKQAIDELKGRG